MAKDKESVKKSEDDKSDLEEFKELYSELKKKFNLPDFKEMNEVFNIERLAGKESDLMLREIRRFIGDYLNGILRMCESLMNPTNAPMFVFSVVKTFTEEEKKKLRNSYEILSKLEVNFIQLDLIYNENNEANLVKSAFDEWQNVRKELFSVLEFAKSKWDTKAEQNGKGYFG